MKFPAYAKINLGLLIGEKRPDGYHNIESVFHRIDLCDQITLERSAQIKVMTTHPDVPPDQGNICYKAAQVLREYLDVEGGVAVSIRKNIPVGAGLGGGSADAGGVLRNLPFFWGRSVRDPDLRRIALQIGSDVPYFLGSGSALAFGRGEVLEYFTLDVPYTILVCYPNIHVSTAWAYQNFRLQPTYQRPALKDLLLEGMSKPERLRAGLRNDFEPIVFSKWPEIGRVKEAMMLRGAAYASMSGSGSSIYGFFSHERSALEAAADFRAQGYQTSLTMPYFRAEERTTSGAP